MIFMSLRDGVLPSKQSPVSRGDCFAIARNDIFVKVNTLPAHAFGRLQSASGEEVRPFVGRTLMPSVLDKAFKGEL